MPPLRLGNRIRHLLQSLSMEFGLSCQSYTSKGVMNIILICLNYIHGLFSLT